jgi:HKD family nuclease
MGIDGIYAKPVCMKKILEKCNAELKMALNRCTYFYISVIITDNSNKTVCVYLDTQTLFSQFRALTSS